MIRVDTLKIYVTSIVFSAIVGSGVYGFGVDYYAAYVLSNLRRGGVTDYLGWTLSTLTIRGVHVGVFVTSFLLAVSVGFLVYRLAELYKIRNGIGLFLSYVLLLHTWPVIMSASNAMRQGIMMSFLFLALYSYISAAWKRFILFLLLAYMSHSSSPFYVGMFAIVFISDYASRKKLLNLSGHKSFLLIALVASVSAYLLLTYLGEVREDSHVIMGDYRGLFLVINSAFVLLYCLLGRGSLDVVTKYLLLFSLVAPIFLMSGFNWQYERLNMVMLIPFVFLFSRLFHRRNRSAYLFATSLTLFVATVYAGMYESFS